MLCSSPGRTALAEHRIDSEAAKPIKCKLPPYRIPHAYRELVDAELREMLASDIIKPSKSEWAAPIVVVQK